MTDFLKWCKSTPSADFLMFAWFLSIMILIIYFSVFLLTIGYWFVVIPFWVCIPGFVLFVMYKVGK